MFQNLSDEANTVLTGSITLDANVKPKERLKLMSQSQEDRKT